MRFLPRPPLNYNAMDKIKSDIEIARAADIKPINDVLSKANIPDDPFAFSPMGRHIAKLNLDYISSLKEKKSNLILVTAITPTPAGEGKTTTSVGLSDGLNKIGKQAVVCLREPSLGPSFGMKGGQREVDMLKLFQWNRSIYILQEIFMQLHPLIIYFLP